MRHLTIAMAAVLLGLGGCGETSSGPSPGAVAECLRERGAVVHRQVDEVTAPGYTTGYYETQSVTEKFGVDKIHIRVRLLMDPSEARSNALMLGKELVEIGPSGASATTEAVEGGEAVIGVTPVVTTATPNAPFPSKSPPTRAAEKLARKCAAVGVA